MECNKNKYFFEITSKIVGNFALEINESQYYYLLSKFKLDLRINDYDYKNGKTNLHLGYRYKYEESKYYDKATHTFIDEGITYMLTIFEC